MFLTAASCHIEIDHWARSLWRVGAGWLRNSTAAGVERCGKLPTDIMLLLDIPEADMTRITLALLASTIYGLAISARQAATKQIAPVQFVAPW